MGDCLLTIVGFKKMRSLAKNPACFSHTKRKPDLFQRWLGSTIVRCWPHSAREPSLEKIPQTMGHAEEISVPALPMQHCVTQVHGCQPRRPPYLRAQRWKIDLVMDRLASIFLEAYAIVASPIKNIFQNATLC